MPTLTEATEAFRRACEANKLGDTLKRFLIQINIEMLREQPNIKILLQDTDTYLGAILCKWPQAETPLRNFRSALSLIIRGASPPSGGVSAAAIENLTGRKKMIFNQ